MATNTPAHTKGRIFKHPLLERLTHTTPALIIGMYTPIIAAGLYYAHVLGLGWGAILLRFVAGVFFWTFVEYWLHRKLFHLMSERPLPKRILYILHGFHHDYPRDTEHLFMPPLPSLVLASLFFGLYYLIMGQHAYAFTPGFLVGYLAYSYTHYCMHTVTNPPRMWRPLWRYHQMHHHRHSHQAFGVSSPLWDHIFGTVPKD